MSKKKNISVSAKKKLKAHLEKTSDAAFKPTESVAWYWWRVINKAAFKDSLPYPSKIVIRKLRGAWGTCLGKKREDMCIVTLSTEINNRRLFIATVAHEMVHQWQWHFGEGDLHHGENFRDWKLYFRTNFGIIL